MCPCGKLDSLARIPVHYTSWMAVVTPADRLKSLSNRCVIGHLRRFVLSLCPFDLLIVTVAFVIRLIPMLTSFFLFISFKHKYLRWSIFVAFLTVCCHFVFLSLILTITFEP